MQTRLVVSLSCLVVIVAALPRGQAPSGLLVRNGRLVDGTGSAARPADVRVAGDTIVEVAARLEPKAGERVIDAAGRVVAPGFIDMHSHASEGIGEHPEAASQVRQGITTALVAQDGSGDLPVSAFLEQVDRVRPAINFAASVGHGTVRHVVMGADFRRAATPAEIGTMEALVERGMKDGAVGLSSGLEYDPGFYATLDELVALARVAGRFGGFYSSHVRDEENDFAGAWKEAIEVGRRAGVPVQISHMKAASKPVWGRVGEGLRALEAARAEGLVVMGDWYPYPYWQSAMYVLIPDRDFENREKWAVGLEEIGGPQNVLITSYRPDPSLEGRTLAEIASGRGIDPASLVVEMVRAAGPGVGIIGTSMVEEDMRAILAHPQTLICSDGQLAGKHPRGYNAFPRVLGRYVREQRVISLEEAVAKMTGRSAAQVGLADRGLVAAGRKADLVVFDPATIADRGTPADPSAAPVGIEVVVVNGQVVLDHGAITDARPGRALRRMVTAP
jgi:N-acyl-D-amino-acid deacylase